MVSEFSDKIIHALTVVLFSHLWLFAILVFCVFEYACLNLTVTGLKYISSDVTNFYCLYQNQDYLPINISSPFIWDILILVYFVLCRLLCK